MLPESLKSGVGAVPRKRPLLRQRLGRHVPGATNTYTAN
jgi:hypothetical protein